MPEDDRTLTRQSSERARTDASGPTLDAKHSAPTLELQSVNPTNYEVHSELARGGMGRIFAAHDCRHDRPVAIKQLLPSTSEARRRFEREALVTARLQHPSIVPVYEAGCWPSGEPFYAMKLIEGEALHRVIASKSSLDERLALIPQIIAVADALSYAHERGIVHRDLKPQNIIVGAFGETVVIDWGVAKNLQDAPDRSDEAPDRQQASGLTVAGTVIGTPAYMAPEQARAEAVDTRVDVYALGAILYQLLAGQPPQTGGSLTEVLDRVAAGQVIPLEQRVSGVPRDLATIVAKAMAPDPAARYPTAKELAADLRRFQTGQLVAAHRYGVVQLTARFIRRYRAMLAVAALALAAIVTITAVAFRRVERDRQDLLIRQARSLLQEDPIRSLALVSTLPLDSRRWPAVRALAIEARARGIPQLLLGHRERLDVIAFSPDGRWLATGGFDSSVRLWDLNGGPTRSIPVARAFALSFSPDGSLLGIADGTGNIHLVRTIDGNDRIVGAHDGRASTLVFSSDGAWLASGGQDRLVKRWPVAGGSPITLGTAGAEIIRVASLSDGRLMAFAGDGSAQLWSFEGESRQVEGGPFFKPAAIMSPSGPLAVIKAGQHQLGIWNQEKDQFEFFTGTEDFFSAAQSFDRRWLAGGGDEGTIRVWDLQSGQSRTFSGHATAVWFLAFSPDGSSLVSASRDRTIRLWNLSTGKSRVLRGHSALVTGVAFSPQGRRLASVSLDATVRVWDIQNPNARVFPGRLGGGLGFDGAHLVVPDANGIREWRVDDRSSRLVDFSISPQSVRILSSGRTIAASSADGTIEILDLATGARRIAHPIHGVIRCLKATRNSSWLTVTGDDGSVVLLDAASLATRSVAIHAEPGACAVSSRNGALVAVGTDDIRRLETSNAVLVRPNGEQVTMKATFAVAFSPDERTTALAGRNTIILVDSSSGQMRSVGGCEWRIGDVSFSPDSTTVAAGCFDHTVRTWDLRSGDSRILRGHEDFVTAIGFSPDGKNLISASIDHTVRLWDLASGESSVLAGHNVAPVAAVWSPQGDSLATLGTETIVWSTELPRQPSDLMQWLKSQIGEVSLDSDGRLIWPSIR